ncbi:hypothetical protein J1614_001979 [Plenodomus biglobosus]|nr:hypothetical protein J1614_001979 [Plenodomus biglobosus]
MIRIHQSISRASARRSVLAVGNGQKRSAVKEAVRKKTLSNHWSNEKLQVNGQYPLAQTLSAIIHPNKEPEVPKTKAPERKAGVPVTSLVHVRSQIVNPGLCDDAINYIRSTLDKHKGCDIIDVNPGAGLWSQKLHDYLKPRSHVLVEPRYDKFQSFLDPLLKAKNSKYKLLEKDPCALETYREIVSEGILPHQIVYDPQDPKAQEVNNTLLVTGSLVWDPRLPGLGFDSMAKQLIHHFAAAARSNDLFHAFGLVRTLFWVQNEDFSPMVADSISGMHKANRFLEMSNNITLVVNAERTERKVGRGSSGREPQYELESLIRTLKTAKAKGFEIPTHRRAGSYKYAADIERITDGTGIMRAEAMQEYLRKQHLAGNRTRGLLQTSYYDCHDEEMNVKRKYPDLNLAAMQSSGKTLKTQIKDHPGLLEVRAFFKKCNLINASTRTKTQIEACADIGEKMYYLEIKALGMKDGPKKDALIKEIEELEEKWDTAVAAISPNHQPSAANEVDERISMRTPPHPRIQWDRRPFEPLVMRPDEVWPQNRLSLVSADPIPKPTKKDIPDYSEWVHDFVFSLFNTTNDPINVALDKMQHGLSDIIKYCPSLKDPKKGGRLMMSQLRIRMLTVEMIDELVTAYKNWPFKAPGSDHSKYFRLRSSLGQYAARSP